MSDAPRPPESGWDPPASPGGQAPPPSGWEPPAGGTPAPGPASGSPTGHQQGAPTPMVVPRWVSSDWMFATKVAGLGQLALVAVGALIAVIGILQQILGSGLSTLDWGAVVLTPVLVAVTWAGGGAGEPLMLTGVVFAFLAYRAVARTNRNYVLGLLADRARFFAAAVKVGTVAAGILLAVGLLLNSFAEDLVARASGVAAVAAIDLTALLFFSLFIGTLTALFALLSVASSSLTGVLGLTATTPALVRTAMPGARRTLLVGGGSLLAIFLLGSLLDAASQSGVGFSDTISLLLLMVTQIIYIGIDLAVLLILGATKFLHEGGYFWTAFTGETSGWMWLAIPILIGAYVAGGIQAARTARPTTQADAAKAALLVGPGVAVVGLLVAMGWTGQFFIEDIIPIALLLPTLWGIVALGGAWLWANQQGLPPGIAIESPSGQAPPPSAGPAGGPPPGDAAPPTQPGGWAPPGDAAPPTQPGGWAPPEPGPGSR